MMDDSRRRCCESRGIEDPTRIRIRIPVESCTLTVCLTRHEAGVNCCHAVPVSSLTVNKLARSPRAILSCTATGSKNHRIASCCCCIVVDVIWIARVQQARPTRLGEPIAACVTETSRTTVTGWWCCRRSLWLRSRNIDIRWTDVALKQRRTDTERKVENNSKC